MCPRTRRNHFLSLIVITRNRREELQTTLCSLKEQDAEFELIVVDNGSDDGSPTMVRDVWPEAVIIELKTNQGVGGGRNRGIEAASGEILVFLDDDASFARHDTLSRITKRFEENRQLGILATNSILAFSKEPEIAAIPRRDKRICETDYAASYFCGVCFALRRELVTKIGLFFEPYMYSCEELDLSWRAIEGGYQIMWAADIVVLHRRTLVERHPGRWVYSNARNRVWLAARHLPWRYVVSHGLLWWGFLFISSVRSFVMVDYVKGVWDSIRGLRGILKERKVLSDATLKTIAECKGRLMY